jgi:hypothetical protein
MAGAGRRGWELFEEDEDWFGLRAVLQVGLLEPWPALVSAPGALKPEPQLPY